MAFNPSETVAPDTFNLKTHDLYFNSYTVWGGEGYWFNINITTDGPSILRIKGEYQGDYFTDQGTAYHYTIKLSQGDDWMVQVENAKGSYNGSAWVSDEIHIQGDWSLNKPASYVTPLSLIGGSLIVAGALFLTLLARRVYGSGLKLALSIGAFSRVCIFVLAAAGSQLSGTRWSLPSEGYWTFDVPLVNLFSRWDGGWYAQIAVNGYPPGSDPISGNWAFFPEYPTLMRGVSSLFFGTLPPFESALVSGFIISNVLFFVAVALFYKLSLLVLANPKHSIVATIFFSFWSGSLFYSAVYSESLFMTLCLAAFYLLERGKTVSSTVLAFLAGFVRSSGFFIAPVFLYYGIQKRKYKTAILQTILIFVPYLMFSLYGYLFTGVLFVREAVVAQQFGGSPAFIVSQIFGVDAKYGSGYGLLYTFELLLIVVPFVWFFISKEVSLCDFFHVSKEGAAAFKYWFLGFGVFLVLLFYSVVLNIHRYAVLILPLYWVGALLWKRNPKVGALYLGLIIADLVVGTVLFSTWRFYW